MTTIIYLYINLTLLSMHRVDTQIYWTHTPKPWLIISDVFPHITGCIIYAIFTHLLNSLFNQGLMGVLEPTQAFQWVQSTHKHPEQGDNPSLGRHWWAIQCHQLIRLHVFGLWEKVSDHGGSPHGHRKNIQTQHTWKSNPWCEKTLSSIVLNERKTAGVWSFCVHSDLILIL